MREVKFRGKRIDNGEWVYGTLILTTSVEEKAYIVDSACHMFNKVNSEGYAEFDWLNAYPVVYETVGQYTGLKSKNGKEVCEDDIVRYEEGVGKNITKGIGVVEYDDLEALYHIGYYPIQHYVYDTDTDNPKVFIEVIGNIHDNKKLLNN